MRSYSKPHKSSKQSLSVYVRWNFPSRRLSKQPEDIYEIILGSCFTFEGYSLQNLAFLDKFPFRGLEEYENVISAIYELQSQFILWIYGALSSLQLSE